MRVDKGGSSMAIDIDSVAAPTSRPPFWRSLYAQVLVAIVLGIALGYAAPDIGASLKPLGDAFIKLVKMIIAPVIFLTVVTGIAGLSHLGDLGRVALKTFSYFLVMSTFALIVGLIVANVVQPGAGMNVDPATLDAGAIADYAHKAEESTLTAFLMSVIPVRYNHSKKLISHDDHSNTFNYKVLRGHS